MLNLQTCQTEITSNYEQFVSFLFNLFKTLKIISYSHTTLGKMFGVRRETICDYYKKLRDDPRFFVGKTIRRPHQKEHYTIKIQLTKFISRLLLSEYVTPSISLIRNYIFNIHAPHKFHKKEQQSLNVNKKTINSEKIVLNRSQRVCSEKSCQRRFNNNPKFGFKCICKMTFLEKWQFKKAVRERHEEKLQRQAKAIKDKWCRQKERADAQAREDERIAKDITWNNRTIESKNADWITFLNGRILQPGSLDEFFAQIYYKELFGVELCS